MRRSLLQLLAVAAALGALTVVLALVLPVAPSRLVDGYVLLVGGLLLLVLARATAAAAGSGGASAFERALRRRAQPSARPPDLARLEREVVLGAGSAFDAHARVRPHLREIASHRLEAQRGLRLDEGGAQTRGLLGEELWELVRPEREPPRDRAAPGLPLDELRGHVDRLERI